MKAHEYSIEGSLRHHVLVFCVLGCAIITGFVGSLLSAHQDYPLLAWIPAPSALALLGLSYSIIWSRCLWRLETFQRLHKVPSFKKKYWGRSRSNDKIIPRKCTLTVQQTWTNMIISYESSLMEGYSITATAFPDTSRVIAILDLKPRKVFDAEWLKESLMSVEEACKFALPQQMVVEFQFEDGMLIKASWYTSLLENHHGEFYGLKTYV
jgi:hypothetical protein